MVWRRWCWRAAGVYAYYDYLPADCYVVSHYQTCDSVRPMFEQIEPYFADCSSQVSIFCAIFVLNTFKRCSKIANRTFKKMTRHHRHIQSCAYAFNATSLKYDCLSTHCLVKQYGFHRGTSGRPMSVCQHRNGFFSQLLSLLEPLHRQKIRKVTP